MSSSFSCSFHDTGRPQDMVAIKLAGVSLAITALLTQIRSVTGQYLATPEDLNTWLQTTTANVELIPGSNFSTPLGPQDVRLIYCSEVIENTTCGGTCFAYQGPGSRCLLPVLRTAGCLAATRSVHMCFTRDCNDCNLYTSCGTRLDNGFCSTPQTNSIQLPVYANITQPVSSSISIPPISSALPSSSSARPSPSASVSPVTGANAKKAFPVGAIVGIALGAAAIVFATILFILWIRRRQRREAMVVIDTHPSSAPLPPPLFTGPSTISPIGVYPRPPVSSSASSSGQSPSGGWGVSGKLAQDVSYHQTNPSSSHTANGSFSSSDASTLAFQRAGPTPAMEIIHEDSGARLPSSIFRQSRIPVVEHPPPYSHA